MNKNIDCENLMTRERFISLLDNLEIPDQKVTARTRARWNNLCKPVGSFGQLELLHQRLAAIEGTTDPSITPRAVFVFAADNGIVAEGVTQCGQEVTAQVMRNIAADKATINILARSSGTAVIPVNLGVRDLSDEDGIVHVEVKSNGTESFAQTEAMSEAEMMLAIQLGYEMAAGAVNNGYKLLIAGEMGIGNTSTSTALLAALEETTAASICGRGAGLPDDKFLRKQEIISAALKKHNLSAADPLTALRTVGGFDIAAMVGFYAAAAINKTPVILDGLITQVAAVVLHKLQPNISHYLFAGHEASEPGCELALRSLGLTSILDLDLHHGEGTGAILALPLLDYTINIYRESDTFDEGGVEPYEVYDQP
ncbi:MAG: nicotinate-nucleotide--dimethylbenzimidazole phosphoribosyltransferase [Eubacteriales bacterium]|nr:nicotinate-nucleotide--dimethylbenzimidazole phosphoribosyltransferase [Eubacteriales bacterium]MDD4541302.1 nicotinate-nucleotide--dimethylbenzimidazole phosphoribosyltransferase [Eubacteriales bacterium]